VQNRREKTTNLHINPEHLILPVTIFTIRKARFYLFLEKTQLCNHNIFLYLRNA